MKKGQDIKMPRLCEHSCGGLAACTLMARIHTHLLTITHFVVDPKYSIAYHALVLAATVW
jgi:hypothetical protein